LVLENDKLSSTSKSLKTGFIKSAKHSRASNASGFTLLELLVVLGVIAVLITLQLPALAGAKSQSKIAMCASHVRQLALACQIYANENSDRLPSLAGTGNWLWDTPTSMTDAMLKSGAQTNTFYCPGTAPRFTDTQDWSGPGLTLWNDAPSTRVIGYSLAFNQSSLTTTNRNTTIQPERFIDRVLGISIETATSDRVLVADATISSGSALPGYAHPENNYTDIVGGYPIHHVSPHLKGNVPAGGNVGFKDGHVDWRKFELMTPRANSGFGNPYFWW
jgi:prepilin-type N-terminal cleavage/methylation domain-containing protein